MCASAVRVKLHEQRNTTNIYVSYLDDSFDGAVEEAIALSDTSLYTPLPEVRSTARSCRFHSIFDEASSVSDVAEGCLQHSRPGYHQWACNNARISPGNFPLLSNQGYFGFSGSCLKLDKTRHLK